MEQIRSETEMLELMTGPAFSVKKGIVTAVNQQASRYGITVGEHVEVYLPDDHEEYTAMESGVLYLTLLADGISVGAAVKRLESRDVFLLEPPQCQPELQAVALAAREFREPLSSVLVSLDKLLPLIDIEDPTVRKQTSMLNRSLHRMLRLVSNMSDAARESTRQEFRNAGAVIGEIFEKAAVLTEQAGVSLQFENLNESVHTMMDSQQLERAVLNLLSNAMKFSQAGSVISAKLVRRGNRLHLSIQDNGSGIPDEVYGTLFTRHLRGTHLEDSRYGIGLGMVLVRSAAIAHGGTVLVQRLPEGGTCVTVTLSVRKATGSNVTSPILLPDYAGGFDHALVELADVLPPEVYEKN